MRLTLLHPVWFVAVDLGSAFGPLGGIALGSALTGFAICLHLLWARAIYATARYALHCRSGLALPDREWLFGIAAVAAVATLLWGVGPFFGVSPMPKTMGAVTAVGFFWAHWAAATAIASFEEGTLVRTPTNKAAGLFLALAYAFIGAWFIRRRLRDLVQAAEADVHSNKIS